MLLFAADAVVVSDQSGASNGMLQTVVIAGGSVILTLFATLGTGAKDILAALLNRLKARAESGPTKKLYYDGLRESAKWREVFESIRDLEYVDRALFFGGKNGGGLPKPGCPYYVRCLDGWASDPKKHPEKMYKGPLAVDAFYMNMVSDIVSHEMLVLTTTQLPEKSILRGYYEKEGVVQSLAYYLGIDNEKNELKYCTIASYSRLFTPAEIAMIGSLIERVRGLMGNSSIPDEYA